MYRGGWDEPGVGTDTELVMAGGLAELGSVPLCTMGHCVVTIL
jgi:hypothetical protein